ncbi:MAG: hypothetical protein C4331_14615 [Meiothermus sp.]
MLQVGRLHLHRQREPQAKAKTPGGSRDLNFALQEVINRASSLSLAGPSLNSGREEDRDLREGEFGRQMQAVGAKAALGLMG